MKIKIKMKKISNLALKPNKRNQEILKFRDQKDLA